MKRRMDTEQPGDRHRPSPGRGRCRLRPRSYVALVAVAAAAVSVPALSQLQLEPRDLLVFALLCLGAAFGSILIVSTERNHGFNTALVFIAAAVVLLPPPLIALMGLAQYWPDARPPPVSLVHPALQPRELDAQRARRLGRLASRRADVLPGSRRSATPSESPPRVSSSSARTTCCWRVRCASDAPARCARRASSRGRASRPISCSPRSASRSPASGSGIRTCVPLTIAPFVLISRSFSLLELLHRSERRFRAIYESTAVGIGLTDTAGRLVDHNRAFGEMLGFRVRSSSARSCRSSPQPTRPRSADGLFDELVAGTARELRARAALPPRRRRGGLGPPDGVGRRATRTETPSSPSGWCTTSATASSSRSASTRRRSSTPSAASPAASHTTSTTC